MQFFFLRGCAPGGNQPDHGIGFPVAMSDDQAVRLKAVTQEHEPFFVLGVIRIIDQSRVFVEENSLCVLE
jgi:hypothetical protein